MTQEEAEDIKRHFNVVTEGLRSEIRLIAEGHVALDQKIDRKNDEVRQEVHEFRAEARSELRLVAESLRRDIADFRREVQGEFRDVRALLRLTDIRLEKLEGQHF
jgi:hypothetical protein